MDAAVVSILSSGGGAAQIVLLYFAWKLVTNLQSINENVVWIKENVKLKTESHVRPAIDKNKEAPNA